MGLGTELIDYQYGWETQQKKHADVVAFRAPNTIYLLEHSSVYTAGRRTESFERPQDGTPVVDVDRGGKITWHGPGQLVGYPIFHLPTAMDVVAHVRRLEDVIIGACTDLGLTTQRVKGRSGVWVVDENSERKIAAIGVRVAKGVTMHGFAINCNNDRSWFDRIVPCGIRDAGVSSLSEELSRDISVSEVEPIVIKHLHRVFDPLAVPSQSIELMNA
jgi:lipoyl(octanoyl) transferase